MKQSNKQMQRQPRSKLVSANLPLETVNKLNEICRESGLSRTALIRQAVAGLLESGANDGAIALNLVLLMEKLQEAQAFLSQDDFAELAGYVENIVKLKGGDKNGSF